MHRTLFLFGILLPFSCLAQELTAIIKPEPKHYAWFLKIEFVPAHQEIFGIPIQRIDSSWHLASVLQKSVIPQEVLFRNEIDRVGWSSFVLNGDFNQDEKEDMALTGVYQTNTKQFGKFILVLTKGSNAKWKKEYLLKIEGSPGFLILSEANNNIEVWHCLHCDSHFTISWDKEVGNYDISEDSILKEAQEEK